ncbi:acyl-CoA dehydrogenase family protein [Nocardioides zeae]
MTAAGTASLSSVPAGHRPPVLDAASAVAAAAELASYLAAGAAERDAERVLPAEPLDRLAASGLQGITVPTAFGGPGLGAVAAAEVTRLLATGDPNVAQVPHSHFVYVNALRHAASDAQRAFFFAEVLAGRRFGNAQSEVGTRHVREFRTALTALPDSDGGGWRLDGEKGYATGALFADWIPVLAHRGRARTGPPDRSTSRGSSATPRASASSTTGTASASARPPRAPCGSRACASPTPT